MKNPGSLKILIVDDEPDLREVMTYDLKGEGFQVVEAANGRSAFDLIKAGGIHLVISDVRMPGGDGIELLDNVQKMSAPKPVMIIVSGFSDLTPEMAIQKGAVALMSKPFDIEEMHGYIEKYLS